MIRISLIVASSASFACAQVSLQLVGTVDVASTAGLSNPEYIGNNPSAVAWNGTDLWVAGFNSSGGSGDAAIVKIPNALANPGSPSYDPRFGVQPNTPNSRGYSGLDLDGNLLVAAYDSGAAGPDGITAWDQAGSQVWTRNARGSSGVGIDPGFGGVDTGTGWTTFGESRRALQDNATGADIYVTSSAAANAGMDLASGAGTLWRDMDFDPLTGDVYLRKSNQVHSCLRAGGNVAVLQTQLSNTATADFVNLQNLAFVRAASESLVFWNDRSVTNSGQLLEEVVRCMRADGTEVEIEWNGFAPATGVGAYDFSYDEASGTLAISDFSARVVHVFEVSAFVEYGTGCQGAGGFTPRIVGGGSSRPNGTLTWYARDLAPNSIGLFVFGFQQGTVPLPLPGSCPVHVVPALVTAGVFVTAGGLPGSGTGSFSLPLPGNAGGAILTAQVAVLENGSLDQTRTSNGVLVELQ